MDDPKASQPKRVYGEGDVVVHGEFGICDVVAVMGNTISIQSHANSNDRHWVDLDVDAGKVKLVNASTVNYKGQRYTRLEGKVFGGVTGRVRLSKEARRAAYFPGRFPVPVYLGPAQQLYIQEREERKAARRAAKRKQHGLTEPPAKKAAQAAETGSATHVWG
jgi:hypothetical protein